MSRASGAFEGVNSSDSSTCCLMIASKYKTEMRTRLQLKIHTFSQVFLSFLTELTSAPPLSIKAFLTLFLKMASGGKTTTVSIKIKKFKLPQKPFKSALFLLVFPRTSIYEIKSLISTSKSLFSQPLLPPSRKNDDDFPLHYHGDDKFTALVIIPASEWWEKRRAFF